MTPYYTVNYMENGKRRTLPPTFYSEKAAHEAMVAETMPEELPRIVRYSGRGRSRVIFAVSESDAGL